MIDPKIETLLDDTYRALHSYLTEETPENEEKA